MGIVIGNRFLKDGWMLEDGRERVTVGDIVAQIDYVCQLLGSADHVGIGSDFDGGYGRELIPDGLDSVADLRLIGSALMERGYGQQEADAILGGNWLRLLAEALPED